MFEKWCSSLFDVRWNGVWPITTETQTVKSHPRKSKPKCVFEAEFHLFFKRNCWWINFEVFKAKRFRFCLYSSYKICQQMKRAILMGRAIDGLIHEPWHPSLLEERISTLKTMTLSWDDEMRKWSFVANNLMSKTRIGTMYGVGGGASN